MTILESGGGVFKTLHLGFLEGFLEPHVVNHVLAYAISMFCCDS